MSETFKPTMVGKRFIAGGDGLVEVTVQIAVVVEQEGGAEISFYQVSATSAVTGWVRAELDAAFADAERTANAMALAIQTVHPDPYDPPRY